MLYSSGHEGNTHPSEDLVWYKTSLTVKVDIQNGVVTATNLLYNRTASLYSCNPHNTYCRYEKQHVVLAPIGMLCILCASTLCFRHISNILTLHSMPARRSFSICMQNSVSWGALPRSWRRHQVFRKVPRQKVGGPSCWNHHWVIQTVSIPCLWI